MIKPILAVAAGLTLAAAPSLAATPTWPENPDWQRYVLAPSSDDVKPVRVAGIAGDVTNPEALAGGAGVTTLTVAPGGAPATVILDYGREVGGLPYFTTASVSGTSRLATAVSESRRYLTTPGTTTLSAPAAAGATSLRVPSVTNFVVGDTVTVGTESAKIASVGTADASTTLFSDAAAGATNLKVAAVSPFAVGDTVELGGESRTVTAVGTQGRATTLSVAAAAGATGVRVASTTGLVAGAELTIGSETATVAGITSAASPNPNVLLTAPLASAQPAGAAVRYPGTGITLDAPLAEAHAQGATVVRAGTGIGLASALTAAHAQEEAVTGTPGVYTGDPQGNFGTATAQTFNVSAPGTQTGSLRGGFRFQAIQLQTAGTVTLSAAGVQFKPYRATPDKYQGYFASSSDELNRMWYAGAYTVQMNTVPAGLSSFFQVPVIFDGAKRDRAVWSGDLIVQDPVALLSLGTNGVPFVKGSIDRIFANQQSNGRLPSAVGFFSAGAFIYANTYSAYSAQIAIQYYRYTGDETYVRSLLTALERATDYHHTLLDANGLVVSEDPDYWQTTQNGEVTEYSLVYYSLLRDMAWLESRIGTQAKADEYTAKAAALKTAINSRLWNETVGAYQQSDLAPGVFPLDANANAIRFGIATGERAARILNFLKGGWDPFGALISQPRPSLADPTGHAIEPLNNTWEAEARFAHGDAGDALELMRRLWGPMIRPDNPFYTGTLWEFVYDDGDVKRAFDSLSHGWSAGPTQLLSEYVLGIQPVDPGYATWSVAPQTGDLGWAQGQVPTPAGPLAVKWAQEPGQALTLRVEAPPGTSGSVTVPLQGRSRTITMDGRVVWQDGAAVGGAQAVQIGDAVRFSGVSGAHTFAFATVTASAQSGVGGTVSATLSLTLGQPATFGTFVPGVDRDYTASTGANVISTAGDAALSVSDPGHLTNGAFALAEPLRVELSKASWTAPAANDPVTITFRQRINATEPLRTGAYSRTLTFTLSTTTP